MWSFTHWGWEIRHFCVTSSQLLVEDCWAEEVEGTLWCLHPAFWVGKVGVAARESPQAWTGMGWQLEVRLVCTMGHRGRDWEGPWQTLWVLCALTASPSPLINVSRKPGILRPGGLERLGLKDWSCPCPHTHRVLGRDFAGWAKSWNPEVVSIGPVAPLIYHGICPTTEAIFLTTQICLCPFLATASSCVTSLMFWGTSETSPQ